MGAILKKEISSYMRSLLTYVYAGAFLLIAGIYFSKTMGSLSDTFFELSFMDIALMTSLLLPLLTMRSFAVEKAHETDRLLFTGGVGLWGVILSKFISAYLLFFLPATLSFLYPLVISFFAGVAATQVLLMYLGFCLFGMALIAFGLFISTLTSRPYRAGAVSVAGILGFWLLGNVIPNVENTSVSAVLSAFSLFTRLSDFQYGCLRFSSILYMLSYSAAFLILAACVLNADRQGGGDQA